MEKLTQKQTEHQLLMQFIQDECFVDAKIKIDYPPVALSMGEKLITTKNRDLLLPIPLATFGNLSVVTAPPKTKKTFFISLLSSVFLSGSNMFCGALKGHRNKGSLFHFDTEQGKWHCQKVFKRPLDMADIDGSQNIYHTYGLRTVNHKSRIDFIEYYLKENAKEPSLVIIDGIADLVSDANNLQESNEIVQKLMKWSASYNCHIINVIHQNFGSSKLGTGHLGSFLEKKAETVIQLEANTVNKEWVTVRCGRSRGFSFETFSFEVNDYGLPCVVDDLYDPLK